MIYINLTTKAEYITQLNIVKKAIFLNFLLEEMRYNSNKLKPIKLNANNQSAIKITFNSINYLRTKYIRNRFYLVRKLITKIKELKIYYVSISVMITNYIIKSVKFIKSIELAFTLKLATSVISY